MGYIRHHAIIVTGGDELEELRDKALQFGNLVTDIVHSGTNGYASFMIVPDGSKEGWERSNDGNDAREKFKEYLNENRMNHWAEWVEVAFGSDDSKGEVTDSAWHYEIQVNKKIDMEAAETMAHKWNDIFKQPIPKYDGLTSALYEIQRAKQENREPKHWCGATGFGLGYDDVCPKCYAEKNNL